MKYLACQWKDGRSARTSSFCSLVSAFGSLFVFCLVCFLFYSNVADESCYGASNICWVFLYRENWSSETIKAYKMSEKKLDLLQNMS